MNTEQVVEMIDAITEGRNYTLAIPGDKESGEAEIVFTPSRFYIKLTEGWGTEHDNTRLAREIAGALIAWANRKEGGSTAAAKSPVIWETKSPRIGKNSADSRGGLSRADWYARNVHQMSQEAKDRNLRDLKTFLTTDESAGQEADIQTAIQILLDNGAQ